MRATLMFSFLQIGYLVKRPVYSMNSLLVSAFVLILINPSVIFNISFQLSYSAVIFLIAFYYNFYKLFSAKTWLGDQIWQSAVVTLIAQAGILALTIMFFNRFPTYFLAANVVIIPLASLIVVMGCVIPMIYPLAFLSKILAFALNKLTSLTEFLTTTAASIPGSSIDGIGMTIQECIMLTIIISSLFLWITKKDSKAFNIMLAFTLIMAIHNLAVTVHLKKTNELIVYNTPNETVIGIRTGKNITIFSSDSILSSDVNKHCSTLGLRYKLTKLNDTPAYIEVSGKKIVITNEISAHILEHSTPDFVILMGQNPTIKSMEVFENFHAPIIVSSSVPQRFRIDDAISQTVHYTRTAGAFQTRL